jgi:flagellar L-ring protein precursor FlgH
MYKQLDSGFRRNDEVTLFRTFCESMTGVAMGKTYLIIALLFIAGCACPREELASRPPDYKVEAPVVNYTNGSIWQASSVSITEDFKARKIGDILTVIITEQASASKEATTGTKRDASASAAIPYFMGLQKTFVNNVFDMNNLISASTGTKFDGSGSTTKKDNLNASITTRVVNVLPNGNLLIAGRRNVKVNNEDMVILLEGTVMPKDISSDNTINSIYIADARISYTGKGVVSDRQSPGWLLNIIDKVWPF